jgi:hypothetical protein
MLLMEMVSSPLSHEISINVITQLNIRFVTFIILSSISLHALNVYNLLSSYRKCREKFSDSVSLILKCSAVTALMAGFNFGNKPCDRGPTDTY